jgi:hypothetical protein
MFRSHRRRETPPLCPDVGEPVSSCSGDVRGNGADSPSFPGYPHMPLPRSQIPVRPRCTWPAPRGGGVLLCTTRCCPPLHDQEDPDDHRTFGIHSRSFGTRSIRFVRTLQMRYAMFASERLPTFLGWVDYPLGIDSMFPLSCFRFPHALVSWRDVGIRGFKIQTCSVAAQPRWVIRGGSSVSRA